MNNTAVNIWGMTFGVHMYMFLLGIHLGEELLCDRSVYSALNNTDSFLKCL